MKKSILKTISLTIALVMLCAGFAFADDAEGAANIPADVAGSAYEEAVITLIDASVITGDTDGLFHPDASLTRAQACVIIVKAMDPPSAEIVGTPTQSVPPSGFSDMTGYKWADGYVSYAVKHGIVKGYPDGTFRPGANVSSNEMLTMVLRASGYSDDEIGSKWPDDYVAKAKEVGITDGIDPLPDVATKEIAAQMTYNKLDVLKQKGMEEDPATDEPAETGDFAGLTYATGKFNDNMTMYADIKISSKAEIYTYGVKSDYKASMTVPKENKLRKDTVNKFKLAETPCLYQKEGEEITLMILPMDAGFSGRIYGVINSVSKTINGKGEKVDSVNTLAAGQEVSWLTKDSSVTLPASAAYLAGEVYELNATDGIIKSVFDAAAPTSDSNFIEITNSTWTDKIDKFSSGIVTLDSSGDMFAVAQNASIYVISDDGKSYTVGKQSDIRKGAFIRAYSISGDGEIASVITIKKK